MTDIRIVPRSTAFASRYVVNDAGMAVLSSPRDMARVKQDLAEAGYRGGRIVALGTAGRGYIPSLTQMGADLLRRAGMDVDLQLSDYATMARRIARKDASDKGGWDVHFGIAEGAFNHLPVTNAYIRGDGKSGPPGWPVSPSLEALRQDWLDAVSPEAQRQVAEAMQVQFFQDAPYIPMGQWLRITAYRNSLRGMPWGFAAFYNLRRAA